MRALLLTALLASHAPAGQRFGARPLPAPRRAALAPVDIGRVNATLRPATLMPTSLAVGAKPALLLSAEPPRPSAGALLKGGSGDPQALSAILDRTFDARALSGGGPAPVEGILSEPLARTAQLSSLSRGKPRSMGRALGESSYVPVTVRKLVNPRLIWANLSLLRRMLEKDRVYVPHRPTPKFIAGFLDAFAYMIPEEDHPASLFTAEEKMFYADRYGGTGIHVNWGSGRSGSAGRIKIKGLGRTPLVGDGEDYDTSHGGGYLDEAVREAIYGEVNRQKLPYGANRVLGIIDTGLDIYSTMTRSMTRRVLIVTEDAVRPAHYMEAVWGQGPLGTTDSIRTKDAVRSLGKALPVPRQARSLPPPQRFLEGLFEFSRRLGRQLAASYAHGLYHGGLSPSNIEFNSRFLDYGAETAQPGFGWVYLIDDMPGAGKQAEQVKSEIIEPLLQSIRKYGTADLIQRLPTERELGESLQVAYDSALASEMLVLTGAPRHLIRRLADQQEARDLVDALLAVATSGATRISYRERMQDKVSDYDLRELLVKLAGSSGSTAEGLVSLIQDDIQAPKLKASLAESYARFLQLLGKEAETLGISERSLAAQMRRNARILNRKRPELYRPALVEKTLSLSRQYEATADSSAIWEFIDSVTTRNRTVDQPGEPVR